jgi:hypothetical protein
MNHILTIHPNGTISTMWTDAIPLQELGGMNIVRASTIEFNEALQVWEVRFSNDEGKVAFSNRSRTACIAWEVETLNRRMELEPEHFNVPGEPVPGVDAFI